MGTSDLTAERLREVLDYDPETGVFVWLCGSVRRPDYVGKTAGSTKGDKDGYVRVKIDGVVYRANRLAWLYMIGEWPPMIVDHENLVRTDNSWANLRLATAQHSAANRSRQRRNRSGLKGVHRLESGKWCAQIANDGKSKNLGHFVCPAAASIRYQIAADRAYGNFARGF